MGRKEYHDRFTEAIQESEDKSGYVCKTCGTHLTKEEHQSLIQKMTAGVALHEPAPFGP